MTKPEQPAISFPWEQTGDSVNESQAAASLFDNPGPDLQAVVDLADGKDTPEPKKPTEEEESSESEESAEEEQVDADEKSDDDQDPADDDEDASDEDEENTDEAEAELWALPDGSGEKVTRDEALKGYLRQADYTRKRQKEAAEHAEELTAVRGKRELLDTRLEKVQAILQKLGPAKPDAALRKTNPGEYAAQLQDYNEFQAELSAVDNARGEISEAKQAELVEWRNDRVAEAQSALVAAVPAWQKDRAVMKKEMQEIGEFLKSEWNVTENDLHNLLDHRPILLAREVLQSRKAVAKSKGKLEEHRSGARLKPGSSARTVRRGASTVDKKAIRQAEKRLAETGSPRDAARLIELEFGDSL